MPELAEDLSPLAIEALRPRAKRYDVQDGKIRGLSLRVDPTGRKTWTFRYRVAGGARRVNIGTYSEKHFGLKKAREAAEELRVRVRGGEDPSADKRAQRQRDLAAQERRVAFEKGKPIPGTFAELAARYLRAAKKRFRDSTWRRECWYVKACILPRWGDLAPEAIRRADVLRLLEEVAEERGGVTGNRTLSAARRILAWALDREEIGANPAASVPRRYLHREKSRERTLTREEVRALWPALEAMHPAVKAAWRLILLTAARPGEVMAMRWADIRTDDINGALWEIPAGRTKSGKTHRTPLSRQALEVLEQVRPLSDGGEFVLPSPRGGEGPLRWLSHSTARLLEATGLERFTPHDLRRTASTWLGDAGTRPDVIERVLGHSLPGVAKVYNRSEYTREVRIALSHLGGMVEEAVTGEKAAQPAVDIESWRAARK